MITGRGRRRHVARDQPGQGGTGIRRHQAQFDDVVDADDPEQGKDRPLDVAGVAAAAQGQQPEHEGRTEEDRRQQGDTEEQAQAGGDS